MFINLTYSIWKMGLNIGHSFHTLMKPVNAVQPVRPLPVKSTGHIPDISMPK